MKMGKNIALLIITIVTLISLIAVATYSYFTASTNLNNKITTNVKMPLRPTFTVSGGGEMTLTVDRNLTLKENAYEGDNNWIEGKCLLTSSKNITITLTGEPGTTCSYNIYYKDTSTNSNYVYAHTGPGREFNIILYKNNINILGWIDYNSVSQTSAGVSKITALFGGSTTPFNQAKPEITVSSGNTSITDTWLLVLQFENRIWDQSELAGKTFKGELYIDDVVCT